MVKTNRIKIASDKAVVSTTAKKGGSHKAIKATVKDPKKVGLTSVDSAVAMTKSNKAIIQSNTRTASTAVPDISKLANRVELLIALGGLTLMAALFAGGRMLWDERYFVSDEGFGYWIGLIGGVLMLLAYCYTMFKYVPALRTKAVMKHWLTVHLFFGMVGPFLIVIHTTFYIGSLNGGIALTTMLLVFASGIMGRYLYSKTHYGLGGKKARVKDLKELLDLAGHKIKSRQLDTFTDAVMVNRDTLPRALWDLVSFGWRSRWLYFRMIEDMRHHLGQMAQREGWNGRMLRQRQNQFKKQLRGYIQMLRKVALYHVYERFFAFWRNAHVPLLYLLLMSGIVHVIAVHMY